MGPGDPHDSNGLAVGSLRERLDRLITELVALRDELACSNVDIINKGTDADDLIEVSTAVERFTFPADTLRKWCREDGCGRKVGGRWMVSAEKLKQRINGR